MLKWLFQRQEPTLSAKQMRAIDPDALSIVERLQRAGFETYLVGGCVRDLLLDKSPKDFDIATQASPQQVKALISRAFIIGKRFRIVVAKRPSHWDSEFQKLSAEQKMFPPISTLRPEREFQITTFRRAPVLVGETLNENVFGSSEDDANRRDFGINALYLNPSNRKIVDFVGGMKDLKSKQLRMIGDAHHRFREDPIRILRALRFCAKLKLKLESATKTALRDCAQELSSAKPERVREELLKILREGTLGLLDKDFCDFGLWPILVPGEGQVIASNTETRNRIEALGQALQKTPWPNSKDQAVLLFLFHFAVRPTHSNAFLENLRTSKMEKSIIEQIDLLLAQIASGSRSEEPNKWLLRHSKDPSVLIAAFYAFKILADAKLLKNPQTWSQWKGPWEEFSRRFAHRPAPGRSTGQGHRKGQRRPRGKSLSGSSQTPAQAHRGNSNS